MSTSRLFQLLLLLSLLASWVAIGIGGTIGATGQRQRLHQYQSAGRQTFRVVRD